MVALIALAVVSFPGGSTNAFIHFLRENNKQDAIVVRARPNDKLPAIDFDADSIESINGAVRSKLSLTIIPGTEPLFTDARASALLFTSFHGYGGTAGRPPAWPNRKSIPADSVVSGKLTFRTENNDALDVESLANAPFGKPVHVHWTLLGLLPSVDVRDLAPNLFLDKLAKALGSRFHETKGAYELEFRAEEFRRRALNSLQEFHFETTTPQWEKVAARLELVKSVMQSLTGDQLSEAFATPGSHLDIALTDGGLRSAAKTYLLALMKNPSAPGGAGPAGQSTEIAAAIKNADPKRPPKLIFTAKFSVEVEIPTVDEKGEPAGVVRF